jgi:hypothetical protein
LGKSRLIEEFHVRLRDTPHTWVEWSCSQLLLNTPLHPVTEWGRQRFGGAELAGERRLAELESSLFQVKLDPAEHVPLLAPLLDIPLPQDRLPALAPEELRRRQLAALTNWMLAGAKVQPMVLAFEDLHWADPTTLDVLRGIAERGALAPLFVVATTRAEFRAPWGMRSHHGTISLAPLDRAQVRDMVAELSARHALPHEVVEDVVIRDRRHLSEDGIVLPIIAINKHTGQLESVPEVVSRGFSVADLADEPLEAVTAGTRVLIRRHLRGSWLERDQHSKLAARRVRLVVPGHGAGRDAAGAGDGKLAWQTISTSSGLPEPNTVRVI